MTPHVRQTNVHTVSVTDTQLDEAAQLLKANLDALLDVLDVRVRGSARTSGTTYPLCRSSDLSWMEDSKGRPIGKGQTGKRFARQIKLCGQCGVQTYCLEIAVEENRTWGIWGGKTPDEIAAERRKRK